VPTGGRVGRAIIEITADYDKFAREAETKINAALRRVGANLDDNPFGTKISRIGDNVGEAFGKGIEQGINRELRVGANAIGARIAETVDNNNSRGRLRRAFDNLTRAGLVGFGSAIALVLGGGKGVGSFLESFKEGAGFFKSLFDSLGNGLGQFLIKAGLGVIIIPHLAAVIFVLVANLTSLLGLLNLIPGVAGVAIGAIIPLVIAFQGFGDAISAVLDGDPEKITKALENLSPAARSVVRDFAVLLPQFRELRKTTQENFFGPLKGTLTDVFGQIGIGKIAQGFANVASAFGHFADQLIRVGTMPGVQKLAAILFGSESNPGAISNIVGSLSGPITRLLDGLANAGASTMPTIEKLFARIGGWIDKIANWLNESAANGEFDQFLKDALETAGDLYDLGKSLLNLLLTIFENTDDGGERFLQKVTNAIDKLSAYFESPEGKEALEAFVQLAGNFADALGVAVGFLETILNLLGQLNALTGANPVGGSLAGLGGRISAAVKAGVKKNALGDVITKPTFSLVGEAGPEAIIPLNNPGRAAEVMSQAGLLPLAASMLAGAGINVTVFLGTRQITDILDSRVSRGLGQVAGAINRGGRQG
jgi:hypothetical protein